MFDLWKTEESTEFMQASRGGLSPFDICLFIDLFTYFLTMVDDNQFCELKYQFCKNVTSEK